MSACPTRTCALDQVRGLAVVMVFMWHGYFFLHVVSAPSWAPPPPIFFLSLLHEGHTGVSLFLTLSGYLFSRLLADEQVRWRDFYWNRAVRLLPLFAVVVLIYGVQAQQFGSGFLLIWHGWRAYFHQLVSGLWSTGWPGGGWTLALELQFYLLLPFLLWMLRHCLSLMLFILAGCLLFRACYWEINGSVQQLSYWTMVGRIDQFILGMIAARHFRALAGRHSLALCLACAFAFFYWCFDRAGGFYGSTLLSPGIVWVFMPLLEGLAYAVLIAWYDASFSPSRHGFSGFMAWTGQVAYSIYLWQILYFVLVCWLFRDQLPAAPGFMLGTLLVALLFLLMLPLAWLSYRWIERPFFRYRRG